MTALQDLSRPARALAALVLTSIAAVLIAALAAVGAAPPSSAAPAPAAAAAALITPTPTSTVTPTPTPDSVEERDAGISCSPTLTAHRAQAVILDEVTFTFDDGCVCTGNGPCDFVPSNAAVVSNGLTLLALLGSPPAATFTATADRTGVINVAVEYFGQRQAGNQFFPSRLAASTVVVVKQTPVVCTPTLTPSDSTPQVGDEVTFTFDDGCTCPSEPALDCGFWTFSVYWSGGGGIELGKSPGGAAFDNDRTFTGTAVAAGPTDVSMSIIGQTSSRGGGEWSGLSPSVTVDVQPAGAVEFECEFRGADLSWIDADAAKYWIYRTSPGEAAETWVGRALGGTDFTDPNPVVGATYRVHYAGISRTACTDRGGSVAPTPVLTCSADAGVVTWNDLGQPKYWVYRSADGGQTYSWFGRTLGAATFTDPNPTAGARYQIRYAGAGAHYNCETITEPGNQASFSCTASNGNLEWSDHGQAKYWLYRSVDGGQTFNWLGRTLGATTFTDPSPVANATYQVHYAGIPRELCQ